MVGAILQFTNQRSELMARESFDFEESHYSMRNDVLWSDVTPISQDDGPHPIAKIQYTDEFIEVYDYMRAVLQSEEKSERAFNLTEKAARLNPANYTVWFYRRQLIRELNCDLDEELRFLDEMIEMNPKNYQVWFHRQKIIEMLDSGSSGGGDGVNDNTAEKTRKVELKFVQSMLDEDAKNYHAWQYRQWLLKTYSLWNKELDYVEKLLKEDIRNNSAWNQRFFVISHTSDYTEEIRLKEIMYTLVAIDVDIYNESAWNYLRGITQTLDSVANYSLPEPYCRTMLDHMRVLLKQTGEDEEEKNSPASSGKNRVQPSQYSPYLCMFAISCFEEFLQQQLSQSDGQEKCKDIVQKELMPVLIKLQTEDDIVRKNYWKFVQLKLKNEYCNIE